MRWFGIPAVKGQNTSLSYSCIQVAQVVFYFDGTGIRANHGQVCA